MTDLCPLCRKQFEDAHARCPDDGTPLIEDRTGQSLGGRYTIRELLGLGGHGVTVWAAWQEDADRMVAVKLLPLDEAGRDHFLDVASQVAALDHPNIVRVYDFNKTEDGLACGVMELVPGRPLSVELSDDRALPVEDALPIIEQLLAGLTHAHEHGLLHLDLRPSNIFLIRGDDDAPPTVKLVDFGLVRPRPVAARFAGPIAGDDKPDEALHYTAPELLASGRAGPQSDLYSVGALLYRLISGKPPSPSTRPPRSSAATSPTSPPPLRHPPHRRNARRAPRDPRTSARQGPRPPLRLRRRHARSDHRRHAR
ncbi:MAG: serine/threonine protein kinase [Myxococcales bacterium]|nr:serine/threonine protein kinase [Myxococcales bacterium]